MDDTIIDLSMPLESGESDTAMSQEVCACVCVFVWVWVWVCVHACVILWSKTIYRVFMFRKIYWSDRYFSISRSCIRPVRRIPILV